LKKAKLYSFLPVHKDTTAQQSPTNLYS